MTIEQNKKDLFERINAAIDAPQSLDNPFKKKNASPYSPLRAESIARQDAYIQEGKQRGWFGGTDQVEQPQVPIEQLPSSKPLTEQRAKEILDEVFGADQSLFTDSEMRQRHLNKEAERRIRQDQGYESNHPYMDRDGF